MKKKFNVNLRANAVVKFQSKGKEVRQMGTCLVPTPAAWWFTEPVVRRIRGHIEARQRRGQMIDHVCAVELLTLG